MNSIKAVIFDMDGVLIDSEPLWQKAEKEIFSTIGLNLNTSNCLHTKGMRIDEVVSFWFKQKPWYEISKEEVVESILIRLIDLINDQGELMEGAIETFQFFSGFNIPLAIATSSPKVVMSAILDKLSINDYFSVLKSADNEVYGKPHPGVYISTAAALKVLPEECLVIEDSINGMIAAKAAKMEVIVIPESSEYNFSEWALADYKLESLLNIPGKNEIVSKITDHTNLHIS